MDPGREPGQPVSSHRGCGHVCQAFADGPRARENGGRGGEAASRGPGRGCDTSPGSPSCRGSGSSRAGRELPSQPGFSLALWDPPLTPLALNWGDRQRPVPQSRPSAPGAESGLARLGHLCASARPCLLFITGKMHRNEMPPSLTKCKREGQRQGNDFHDS